MEDVVLPELSHFQVSQSAGRVFIVGGQTARGVANNMIYEMGTSAKDAPKIIGNLSGGPGTRNGTTSAAYNYRKVKLLVFGGIDQEGVAHNDLWEFDVETGVWSQIATDCFENGCPPTNEPTILAVDIAGEEVAVYPANDPEQSVYYKLGKNVQKWVADRELYRETTLPAVDCDNDGYVDAETSKACRGSGDWYADVGQKACSNAKTGEKECTAKATETMLKIAEWSPDGWEWIVDFAAGDEEYDYVLTDSTLYTFDVYEPDAAIYPVDEDEIQIPGNWWWQDDTDWSFQVELTDGFLFVGSFSGLHVFSLDDPANPEEIGYMPSHGIVRDIVVAGEIAYLADGSGITVVDIRNPSEPLEIERKCLGTMIKEIEYNERDWRLLALTPFHIRKFDVLSNPANPGEVESIGLLGLTFWEMRTEGRWNYLNGLWTRSLYDDPNDGLQTMGDHDVRAWVQGRELREGQAERLNLLQNKFEIWGEE
jgi:hypothetical protein